MFFCPSDLESCDDIADYLRRGRSEYFVEIRIYLLCYMALSHTNTNTVRGKEIWRFRNRLVLELKVNERKPLIQSKTLCLNRRHQFLQSEDNISYTEKRFAKGKCIMLKSAEIWTIEEDYSKSNSKEKEVQSFVLCVDQLIDCQQLGRKTQLSSFRKGCDRNLYPCSSFGFVWKSRFHTWGGGGGVFFGWVCAPRDSKLAPRSKKNFPKN